MKIINNIKITSPYGDRILNGQKQFHDGIDFISKDGDRSVYCPVDGVCCFDFDDYEDRKRWTDNKHSGGNYTIIQTKIDDEIYYFKFLHLVENYITKGQVIKAGQKIGKYADVGYSFGAHLHLSIYNSKWQTIDQTPILKKLEVI
jgi:murein DD-endopeptidase MepM/ murein hydrolase activator NlpD